MIEKLDKLRYRIGIVMLVLSAAYLVATTIWVLKEPPTVLLIMEILTILSAFTILAYFVIFYQQIEENNKAVAIVSLILASAMATITIANHFVYMTVITPIYGTLANTPTNLRLDGWPSVTKALECVSWAFLLGLAMIVLSFALNKKEHVVKWILRIFGVIILIGLIGPFIQNMIFYFFSTIGYTLGFLVLAIYDVCTYHKTK